MAVFTFTSVTPGIGAEFELFFKEAMPDFVRLDLSGTRFLMTGTAEKAAFFGTGLEYTMTTSIPLLSAGTLTAINMVNTGLSITPLKITGLNLNAKTVFEYISADQFAQFAALLMSANDQITLTQFNDTIDAAAGNDIVHAGNGNDYIVGGAGNDRLFGEGGMDNLNGGNGSDSIYGGAGAESIMGGAGNDMLYGGAGENSFYGNGGSDQFILDAAPSATTKVHIYDFTKGSDKIVLDNDVFTALAGSGALTAAQFRVGTAAADASDRIIFNSATNQVFYDRDGNGAQAAIELGTVFVTSMANLQASDFFVLT